MLLYALAKLVHANNAEDGFEIFSWINFVEQRVCGNLGLHPKLDCFDNLQIKLLVSCETPL